MLFQKNGGIQVKKTVLVLMGVFIAALGLFASGTIPAQAKAFPDVIPLPDGWFPEQKISMEEAIRGYTLSAAYTEFAEHLKGSLEEGKLADLVILDQNLFEISPDRILDTRVIMTILDGKIIHKY